MGEGGSWGFSDKSHEDLGADGWEQQKKKDIDEMGFGRDPRACLDWGRKEEEWRGVE